jgi:uncharacterized damage-inducible protein DinB
MERDQILTAMRTAPERLQEALAGAGERAARPPAEGEWSAKEVLAHLRTADAIFSPRIVLMMMVNNPAMPDIDASLLAERCGFLEDDLQTALRALTVRRGELVQLLERLDEAGWQRGGVHEVHGPLTIADIARLMAAHEQEHLAQIEAALK